MKNLWYWLLVIVIFFAEYEWFSKAVPSLWNHGSSSGIDIIIGGSITMIGLAVFILFCLPALERKAD